MYIVDIQPSNKYSIHMTRPDQFKNDGQIHKLQDILTIQHAKEYTKFKIDIQIDKGSKLLRQIMLGPNSPSWS